MLARVEVNIRKLHENLLELCKTSGPTQACVRMSEKDARVKTDLPMETKIKEIVQEFNEELTGDRKPSLRIVRHMGNLVVIGGVEVANRGQKLEIENASELSEHEIKAIRKIPVVFGAHLDEITYIIANRESSILDGKVYRILPICNPPKIFGVGPIRKIRCEDERDKKPKMLIVGHVFNPEGRVVGFRSGEFKDNIGTGEVYKVDIEEEKKRMSEKYLLLKLESKNVEIRKGDMVIQDYGDWKEKDTRRGNSCGVVRSKALDDRVGCIAAIYAVKELSRRGVLSKAVLTSSEEGVPSDISWGRLVQATYSEFCTDDIITLICDGMDGRELTEFKGERRELSKALIIPYTSYGKGGGDVGIFSLLRDEILRKLERLYGKRIAATSTDYSSRSYDVKVMDRWTLIGFVQWTCGVPLDESAACHNEETVNPTQIVNIIRVLVHSAEYFHKTGNKGQGGC